MQNKRKSSNKKICECRRSSCRKCNNSEYDGEDNKKHRSEEKEINSFSGNKRKRSENLDENLTDSSEQTKIQGI